MEASRESPASPGYPRHALFVPLADASGAARQVAEYVSGVAAPLRLRGVAVEAHRVRPGDLRNRRVLAALRRRGIDRLPALLAGGHPYVGLRAIRELYDGILRLREGPGPAAPARRRGAPRPPGPRSLRGEAPEGASEGADAGPDDDPASGHAAGEPASAADEEAAGDLAAFFAQEMRATRLGQDLDRSDSAPLEF